MESPNHDIIPGREHEHSTIDGNAPIHGTGDDGRGGREEKKHIDRQQETHRRDINREAIAAQRPSPRRQRLPAHALQQHAADADQVRGHDGDGGEGEDGVESDGRADVDHGEGDGDEQGDDDGVEGDVPPGRDLVRSAYV